MANPNQTMIKLQWDLPFDAPKELLNNMPPNELLLSDDQWDHMESKGIDLVDWLESNYYPWKIYEWDVDENYDFEPSGQMTLSPQNFWSENEWWDLKPDDVWGDKRRSSEFQIPPGVYDKFKMGTPCPMCGSTLYQDDEGKIYCSYCPWDESQANWADKPNIMDRRFRPSGPTVREMTDDIGRTGRKADPIQEYADENGWALLRGEGRNNSHRLFGWVDDQGRAHTVTATGWSGNVTNNRYITQEIGHMKRCMKGLCDCPSMRDRDKPTEQPIEEEVKQKPFYPGDKVLWKHIIGWITEIVDDLAAIHTEEGEDELAPLNELTKTADYFYDWQGYYPDDGSLDDGIIQPNSPGPAFINMPNKCINCGDSTPPGHLINLDEYERKEPYTCPKCRNNGYNYPMEYDKYERGGPSAWNVMNKVANEEVNWDTYEVDNWINTDEYLYKQIWRLADDPVRLEQQLPNIWADFAEYSEYAREVDVASVDWEYIANDYYEQWLESEGLIYEGDQGQLVSDNWYKGDPRRAGIFGPDSTHPYEQQREYLQKGRDKTRRRLKNNTWLEERQPTDEGNNPYAVKLHNTDVITFHPNFFELNTGNWYTVTTKRRINEHIPQPYQVYGTRDGWMLYDRQNGLTWPFENHMRVSYEKGPVDDADTPLQPHEIPLKSRGPYKGEPRGDYYFVNPEQRAPRVYYEPEEEGQGQLMPDEWYKGQPRRGNAESESLYEVGDWVIAFDPHSEKEIRGEITDKFWAKKGFWAYVVMPYLEGTPFYVSEDTLRPELEEGQLFPYLDPNQKPRRGGIFSEMDPFSDFHMMPDTGNPQIVNSDPQVQNTPPQITPFRQLPSGFKDLTGEDFIPYHDYGVLDESTG